MKSRTADITLSVLLITIVTIINYHSCQMLHYDWLGVFLFGNATTTFQRKLLFIRQGRYEVSRTGKKNFHNQRNITPTHVIELLGNHHPLLYVYL
ncbi:Transcription activator of gluconeogenesis acuK [Dirofilaria immitis]